MARHCALELVQTVQRNIYLLVRLRLRLRQSCRLARRDCAPLAVAASLALALALALALVALAAPSSMVRVAARRPPSVQRRRPRRARCGSLLLLSPRAALLLPQHRRWLSLAPPPLRLALRRLRLCLKHEQLRVLPRALTAELLCVPLRLSRMLDRERA
eukprot:scaffold68685_cov74-Phaeocystis_antarctica.AAC.1